MATNKRMRGIAVHRAIVIGSTATPLSDIEKISCPPDHTHKWTIAVRSAASHPLPTISDPENVSTTATTNASVIREDTATPAPNASLPPSAPSGVSTRGREHETDYHKMVGGKDDISHFIKRVQFKLHETYPQSTRNIDRPPFQVTETGWGEFDVQIRIMFIPESGEKPITTYHRLKLHPWHPIALRAPQTGSNDSEVVAVEPAIPQPSCVEQYEADTSVEVGEEVSGREDVAMQVDVKQEAEQPSLDSAPPMDQQQQQRPVDMSNSKHPPVVHSWSYDEVVFPEPTEAFYEILLANPPTPLPTQSAHAFADVAGYNKYKSALTELDASSGPQGRDPHREAGIKPPHPLHNSSGALFDALSQEAVQAEAERFDKARFDAVSQLEETRNKLIEGERKLREGTLNQSRMMTL